MLKSWRYRKTTSSGNISSTEDGSDYNWGKQNGTCVYYVQHPYFNGPCIISVLDLPGSATLTPHPDSIPVPMPDHRTPISTRPDLKQEPNHLEISSLPGSVRRWSQRKSQVFSKSALIIMNWRRPSSKNFHHPHPARWSTRISLLHQGWPKI